MSIICIDPGASGGIAWIDADGNAQAANMPASMTAICDWLRAFDGKPGVVIEKVGTGRPGNAAGAMTTFARHCGNLDAALYLLGYPIIANPTPNAWMRLTGCPAKLEKSARKKWLKDYAQRRYPHLRVTLKTSDALAMLAVADKLK